MDRNEVQARIIEVAQLVKATLVGKHISIKDKCNGYKYVDDVQSNLRRLFLCFDLLDPRPGSSVFEIGPGNCFFLFMCRELRGCRVAGVDKITDKDKGQGQNTFRLFREHFGLADAIKAQFVEGMKPVDFGRRYDAIVATRAHFNRDWQESAYRFWLRDCYEHLQPEGKLLVHFRTIEPEIVTALPLLQPQFAIKDVKKVSVISRESIGQVTGRTHT
jgi:hypothetical protein